MICIAIIVLIILVYFCTHKTHINSFISSRGASIAKSIINSGDRSYTSFRNAMKRANEQNANVIDHDNILNNI